MWHTSGFIVVDVDSFQLKVRVAVVAASRINTMFVGDHLPELTPQTQCLSSSDSDLQQFITSWFRAYDT